jgi:hypothetical protein
MRIIAFPWLASWLREIRALQKPKKPATMNSEQQLRRLSYVGIEPPFPGRGHQALAALLALTVALRPLSANAASVASFIHRVLFLRRQPDGFRKRGSGHGRHRVLKNRSPAGGSIPRLQFPRQPNVDHGQDFSIQGWKCSAFIIDQQENGGSIQKRRKREF